MPTTYQNTYTNLPTLDEVSNLISRDDIRAYLDTTNYTAEQKTAVMTMIRKEAARGDNSGLTKKAINNNLGGVQADGARWDKKWEQYFTGVVYRPDWTGTMRWFIAFDTWQHCVDFMLANTKKRGIYFGGFSIPHALVYVNSIDSFVTAYLKEWVEGSSKLSKPTIYDYPDYKELVSIYNQEYKYFSQSVQKKNQQFQDILRSALDDTRYNIRFALFGK